VRNIADPTLANVTVPLSRPGLLHRLVDPDAGDTLLVVTAPAPISRSRPALSPSSTSTSPESWRIDRR